MKLKEHLVARKVVKDEINRMIEDFQSKDSTFCSEFIQFELEENVFGVVALSDL